jgi:hypothetical protein
VYKTSYRADARQSDPARLKAGSLRPLGDVKI